MRRQPMLAATAVLATGIFIPAIGFAQSGPSAEEIVKSLTPTNPGSTDRGLAYAPTAAGHEPWPAGVQRPMPAPPISLTLQFGKRVGCAHATGCAGDRRPGEGI
jgi:hypothetical protein